MIDFFLSSDLHFGYWRAFSKFLPDGTTTRLQIIKKVLDEGLKKADTDLIIFTGDILHSAKSIDATLASFVRKYFDSLKGKRVFVLPGNHDLRQTLNGPQSMIEPILPEHIEYIKEPRSISITSDVIFHFLPFMWNIDRMKEAILNFKLKYDKINILFSHFTPNGAKIRDDFSSGEKFGCIGQSHLSVMDYSFLGDCHYGNQELNGKIFIPGSPVQHTFGEEDTDKFTYKITIKNSVIEKIKIPSNSPQFKTITITSEEDLTQLIEVNKDKCFMRIISKIPSIITKIDTRDIQVIEIPKEITFSDNKDYKFLIQEYVQEKNPSLTSLLLEYL